MGRTAGERAAMHFSYWMVLVAAVLPYVCVGLAKAQKSFDNVRPRDYLAALDGWRARAHWAHLNHFEAFPAFAAAVIVAELKGAPQGRIDLLAGLFIALRIAYTAAYLANQASLRSVIWIAGLVCVVVLFVS
jgi:uncharacterized MAPEG superfamily protein